MLRATTACTFSTAQLPKVVRSSGALSLFTWKCASRHNGVQFFLSHLASWLRTRRFSEPTFRPSGATNHWKNTVLEINPPFAIDVSTFTRLRCKLHQNMSSACRLNEATKTSSQRRQSPILGVNCSNFVFPHLRVTCVFQEKCQAASSKLQRPNAA